MGMSQMTIMNQRRGQISVQYGHAREEKREAIKPWYLSLIIKLVGRMIGYQFLLWCLQAMWRPHQEFALIDPCNNFLSHVVLTSRIMMWHCLIVLGDQ